MPARLHHERIAHSAAEPQRWMLLTHGIYGAGSNWRGIARKLVDKRRDWGVVLVDLRAHGRSEPGDPPHTIDACADDISALVDGLRSEIGDVRALAGHSFGGKVMLTARSRIDVAQTWLLDSSPAARPGALENSRDSVVRVLHLLEKLPTQWPSREEFIAAVQADGHDLGLAQWLAMNLTASGPADVAEPSALGNRSDPGVDAPVTGDPATARSDAAPAAYINRLDVGVLRALLGSYFATDAWDLVGDAARGRLDVVAATRAPVLDAADCDRLRAAGDHVHVHEVAAGHWLHVEAPGAVVDSFASQLIA